tara:strand:+ start:541 stop:1383 length:843 start_codon:yes stop_codon:yes gene_type:complete
MKNGLYIVATPIGNLNDITFRAIEVLKSSDVIICENPKHSIKLLSKFDIKKKLISIHDYNEEEIIDKIKETLKNNKFSLISDAGSPLISDPGYKLVRFCIANGINVTVVPGPSAVTSALQISSIPINKYSFYGFLPKSKKGINEFIEMIGGDNLTSVFFVSSHKILTCIEGLSNKLSDRKIAVCKELTKLNERVFIGNSHEVLEEFKKSSKNTLGEFVVLVEGASNQKKSKSVINYETIEVIQKLLVKFSLTDTVEIVHKIGNIGKKQLYEKVLEIQNEI